MHVDFDHAGIGRDLDDVQARIGRRQIAFDLHRQTEFFGGGFDGRQHFQIVLEPLDRRHEDAQPSAALLDYERGPYRHVGAARRSEGHNVRLRHQSHALQVLLGEGRRPGTALGNELRGIRGSAGSTNG